MATMNISLPEPMKKWVAQQAESGSYSNASDYIRDLIRKDSERQQKIRHLQALVTEGLASGVSERSMEALKEEALEQLRDEQEEHGVFPK